MRYTWKRIVIESLPLLIFTSFVSTFAGSAIESAISLFTVYPGLLLFIPAFLDGCGDINSTFASKIACTMHMLGPDAVSFTGKYRNILFTNIIFSLMSTFAFFTIFSIITQTAGTTIGIIFPSLEKLLFIVLSAAAIVSLVLIMVAIITTKIVVRYNLDPDNFGSPLVATAADLFAANVYVFICFIVL